MDRVLLWLYTLDYPHRAYSNPSSKDTPSQETVPPTLSLSSDSEKETNRLVIHARVYALADRFDIPELREVAIAEFKKFAPHRSPESDGFVAAALEVLRSTPVNDSGLRPIIKRICAQHLDSIRADCVETRDGRMVDCKSWESIFKEDVDFTWEVMKTAASMHRAHRDELQHAVNSGLALAELADVAQRDSCIICRQAFRPFFEVVESADTPWRVQLRCSHCNEAYRSEEVAEPY